MFQDTFVPTPIQVLDPSDPFDGLTSKQQMFVAYSFSGLSDSEAYRRAYDCSNMNEHSIGAKAHETAHNVKIMAKLRSLQDKRDSQIGLTAALSRQWITDRLMKLADGAAKESVKLGALIALGKMVGIDMFRETTRVERVERTVEDVDRELRERLAALAPMIEGQATPVSSSPKPRADRRRKPVTKA